MECQFSWFKLAAKPVQLRYPVIRGSASGFCSWVRQPLASSFGFGQRTRPLSVQLHDFGAVQQASSTIGTKVGLRCAPGVQCGGPFLSSANVESFAAGFDHAAVNAAGNHWRNFSGGDCNHGLVQQSYSARDFALTDQGAPLPV